MTGIIASLTLLGVSMVFIRLASIALHLTGLSWEAASFQARSAFTGTGFSTGEAEKIMGNLYAARLSAYFASG